MSDMDLHFFLQLLLLGARSGNAGLGSPGGSARVPFFDARLAIWGERGRRISEHHVF